MRGCSFETLEFDSQRIVPFPHQIGGFSHKDQLVQILQEKDSTHLLKPLHLDLRGETEVQFYRSVFSRRHLEHLRTLVPEFHGIVHLVQKAKENTAGEPFLRIQDVTAGFDNPSIMDIKIGKQSFDKFADEQKRKREREKYPHQEQVGFRVIGLKKWIRNKKIYEIKDKKFGRNLLPQQISKALADFFQNNRALIDQVIRKLKLILEILSSQNDFWLFSSSLLFVYDEKLSKADVYMIDFAHALPKEEEEKDIQDTNYLFGVEKLIFFLESSCNCLI